MVLNGFRQYFLGNLHVVSVPLNSLKCFDYVKTSDIIIIIIIISDADSSRVSIAIVRMWFVCLSVCLSVRTIKQKRLKPKSSNLAQEYSLSRYLAHQWILGQKGHEVQNVATRQPCSTVSLRNETVPHSCLVARRHNRERLIQGDRVIGVSYALYRVPSI